MDPAQFVEKWRASTLKESAGAQEHFSDLCRLLGEPTPAEADAKGEDYAREYGATKSTGGQGFADVFKRGHFGWEYKGPGKDLVAAYDQLLRYAVALDNPPLLVVSDTKRIVVHTNFTNTVRETHELSLDDLLDAKARDLLKAVFTNPEALKPKKTRQDLTKDAADEFSVLAQRLRDRGHAPETVAHFVNRLVFCMFAEDVGLLPNKLFQRAMEVATDDPSEAQGLLVQLFRAMNQRNGRVGYDKVPWFNGGLFDTDEALALDKREVALALKAARLDWSDIDPSILGTLFERGLDPSKRSQLGAHYTDREKIMMIVEPVIVRPLTVEWEAARETIAAEMEKAAGKGRAATNARKRAEAAREAFLERLAAFRVLDPACGSGNFLYLSLLALKDIEHRANLDAEALGLPRGFPRVGPEAVRGIEINPYAAELARVSVWIGEIQWMRRNGFAASTNPVLRPLDHIECRDAVLAYDEDGTPVQAKWPAADVIVGNPPFLGDRWFHNELGENYSEELRTAYDGSVPRSGNLVTYWFQKSSLLLQDGSVREVGLVSTSTIRNPNNRWAIDLLLERAYVTNVRSNMLWEEHGSRGAPAAVRVSIIALSTTEPQTVLADGREVSQVYSDLSVGAIDITETVRLQANSSIAYQGIIPWGKGFIIDGEEARAFLLEPTNPNGRPNSEVLKPYLNARDVTQSSRDKWIIEFTGLTKKDAALFASPFAYLQSTVRKQREETGNEKAFRDWFLLWNDRKELVRLLESMRRYLVCPRVSDTRAFVWYDTSTRPDTRLVAFARDDDTFFGVLQSSMHDVWTSNKTTKHGVGDTKTYSTKEIFETFPFPEGLTPDIPAEDYAGDPRAQAIAKAAKRLDGLRERWLNPPEWTERVPEVVPGYPDRVVPKDEAAAKQLKARTLTNLYNERPAWLDHAHRDLDRAVAAAYGWGEDFEAGALTDDEVLARLFALNQARATKA